MGTSLLPGIGPGLVTAQRDPRISQFSRISQQIPSNSRFHIFQQSVLKGRSPVVEQIQRRQASR